MERPQGGIDLLHEVEIDLPEAVCIDGSLGLAEAEVVGFVGSDVEEGRGVQVGQLGELVLDDLERAGLAGREHGAMGGFGLPLVLLPDQRVAKVPEGFLLRNDRDVVLLRVGHQLTGVGGGQASPRRGRQRVGRVLLGVLEVG